MSPSDSPDHPGSILYDLESSEVPYFHKPITGQELFFAVSYSKPALVRFWFKTNISKYSKEIIVLCEIQKLSIILVKLKLQKVDLTKHVPLNYYLFRNQQKSNSLESQILALFDKQSFIIFKKFK